VRAEIQPDHLFFLLVELDNINIRSIKNTEVLKNTHIKLTRIFCYYNLAFLYRQLAAVSLPVNSS